MPRKTRRQLVGKQEDVDCQEREDALRVLQRELHQLQTDEEKPHPQVVEPAEIISQLFQAKIRPLTVHI